MYFKSTSYTFIEMDYGESSYIHLRNYILRIKLVPIYTYYIKAPMYNFNPTFIFFNIQ